MIYNINPDDFHRDFCYIIAPQSPHPSLCDTFPSRGRHSSNLLYSQKRIIKTNLLISASP